MPQALWENLRDIFQTAIELPANKRAIYLDDACAGDPALRQAVESLLKSPGETDSLATMSAPKDSEGRLMRAEEPEAGKIIGHYRILSLLGKGGMGTVYLAEDTKLHRRVSLKFLSSAYTHDLSGLRRFEQEARAISALNHPNILTIYEVAEENGHQFIATELIEGRTLRERLNSPFEVEATLEIAIQVASALVAAHRVSIIHRDIKPENIMIRNDDGLVKLLDFGLAKVSERPAAELNVNTEVSTQFKTAPGVVMGTVAYMAPEQARGEVVDERADIWSLGVVLYEMIAGSPPFKAASSNEIISAILSREPAAPLTRYSHLVPERLVEIIEKTLAKNRDERYQTCKDLLIDLKRLKQSLELKAGIDRSALSSAAHSGNSSGTPREIHRTSSAEYIVNQASSHKGAVIVTSAILLLVLTGVLFYTSRAYLRFRQDRSSATTAAAPITTLAVLPFKPLSNTDSEASLELGMADALITRLSNLKELTVRPTSAVIKYSSANQDLAKASRELQVDSVLDGRVQRSGDRIRVTVQLIRSEDGKPLWAEQFDERFTEVFALEDSLSEKVAHALALRLSGPETSRLQQRYTDNLEAYQLYLKGRYQMNMAAEGALKAASSFQQAIEKDPKYALAYAGLSDADAALGFMGVGSMNPGESFAKAKAAARKALELDSSLADAHNSLAGVLFSYDWNWSEAEKEFKRATELNPNLADAHHGYSEYLQAMARWDEALAEIRRAQELDPLSVTIGFHYGLCLFGMGRSEEALAQYRKTLDIDSSTGASGSHWGIAMIYEQKGMYEEAIRELEEARRLDPRPSWRLAGLAEVYAQWGKRKEAMEMLHQLLQMRKETWVSPSSLAQIYAALGDKDQAFVWLNTAIDERETIVPFFKVLPLGDLRADPRFQQVLERAGIVVSAGTH
jgi:serine/threonine-protein kinase